MRKLILILAALLLAAPAAMSETVVDVSGIWQRATTVVEEKVNAFDFQTSLLYEIAPGLRGGFQAVMGPLGDIEDGGAMVAYQVPYKYTHPEKGWWVGGELLGWLNNTEDAFDFNRSAMGIGFLVGKDTSKTVLTLKLLRGRSIEEEMVAFKTVSASGATITTYAPVEIKRTDFVLTFGVRFQIIK
jgi:hypothetical protein